ncbi:uncharacterized protein METZ01_LOCUS487127 [marine metagenome]|uniref:Uncharacterized protein n=1 Tax=marine metagenome TaxID=408172 RepID=A0A383CQF5_9ZZZZ
MVRRIAIFFYNRVFNVIFQNKIAGLRVPETGVEPARLFRHTDLNRARLPIPPPGHLD